MANRLSVRIRFAALPLLIGLIAFVEASRSPFFFRFITFALVFLLFADLASLLRGKWRDGMTVLAALAFGLCVVEGIANVLEPWQTTVTTRGLSVPRPIIGTGPAHPGRFHATKTDLKAHRTIFDVDYTIDSHLLRQTISNPSGPAIVFFGDSFVFGWGVNDSQTLPQLFADAIGRNIRVVNAATPGFGAHQFLQELQTGMFDSAIGPQPKLFIFMTAGWVTARSACVDFWSRLGPRYVLEKGQLVYKGPCYAGPKLWVREWLENTALFRHFIEPQFYHMKDSDVELVIRLTLAAVKLAKEKYGAPVLVPYLTGYQEGLKGTSFDDAAVVKRLAEGGAYVVDLSLSKEKAAGALLTIPGDGHPTELANRLRAQLLKDYIAQHLPKVLSSATDNRDARSQ